MPTLQLENFRALLRDTDFSTSLSISEGERAQAIKDALISAEKTAVRNFDVRSAANTFYLEAALGGGSDDWADVLNALAACLQNDVSLRKVDDKHWERALLIANEYVREGKFKFSNARICAVAECGKKVLARGFRIVVQDDAYAFEEGELERATTEIRNALAELGPGDVLGNIFRCLKAIYPFDFGMYLPHRKYASGDGSREPSFPFAFMINIAAGTQFPRKSATNPSEKWLQALHLAQEIVGCLNIEPYFNMTHAFMEPNQIEERLRELALYDHLFALRQWRYDFTSTFIKDFFTHVFDEIFREKLGWTPADVVTLIDATKHFTGTDPNLVTKAALVTAGIRRDLLDRMLPHFVAPWSDVNRDYNSPLAAKQRYTLMFKPFIAHGPEHILLTASTMLGPAFFEATMSALRPHIPKSTADDLSGKGTERVAKEVFRRAGFHPTHEAAKYSLSSIGDGECDFIFETEKTLLFVECKAKALTRATMAGISGEALLDFAGGIFSAQKQALRHERILRQLGEITFEDGTKLRWNNRKIFRLSVTLLDLGAMQDRVLFSSLFNALSRSSVQASPGYGKTKQVAELNEELGELRAEINLMAELGVEFRSMSYLVASLSIGQLEACAHGFRGDLDEMCSQLFLPMTHGALNPLAELHYLRTMRGK